MSRENLHDLMNFDEVIERFKNFTGLDSKKKIAELFGIKQNSFSNQKKTGGLIVFFIKYGIQLNMNLNWLFTGRGERKIGDDIIDILKLKTDLTARIVELEKKALGYGKIRQGDPEEKKDNFMNMREGVIHVQFNRKENSPENG